MKMAIFCLFRRRVHSARLYKLKYAGNKCRRKHNIELCTSSKDRTNNPKTENTQKNVQDLAIATKVSYDKNNVLLKHYKCQL